VTLLSDPNPALWNADRRGFDRKGFDRKGFDRKGFDRKYPNCRSVVSLALLIASYSTLVLD
jgi:hypothetical protein